MAHFSSLSRVLFFAFRPLNFDFSRRLSTCNLLPVRSSSCPCLNLHRSLRATLNVDAFSPAVEWFNTHHPASFRAPSYALGFGRTLVLLPMPSYFELSGGLFVCLSPHSLHAVQSCGKHPEEIQPPFQQTPIPPPLSGTRTKSNQPIAHTWQLPGLGHPTPALWWT